jgi:hypothetical protein
LLTFRNSIPVTSSSSTSKILPLIFASMLTMLRSTQPNPLPIRQCLQRSSAPGRLTASPT